MTRRPCVRVEHGPRIDLVDSWCAAKLTTLPGGCLRVDGIGEGDGDKRTFAVYSPPWIVRGFWPRGCEECVQ